MKVVSIRPEKDGDITVTLRFKRSLLLAWLLRRPETYEETYVGECTVWHRVAVNGREHMARRAGTDRESELYDVWAAYRLGQLNDRLVG